MVGQRHEEGHVDQVDVELADAGDELLLAVRYCAGVGYNVIAEGIFLAEHYREMLSEVLAEHRGQTHVFYLDVPLEETLRRHRSRPLGTEVSAGKRRDWYVQADTLGVSGEIVLDGTADLESTVELIRGRIGPVPTRIGAAQARFL